MRSEWLRVDDWKPFHADVNPIEADVRDQPGHDTAHEICLKYDVANLNAADRLAVAGRVGPPITHAFTHHERMKMLYERGQRIRLAE